MKAELQQYVRETFGNEDLNVEYSLAGQVYVRFELGGDLPSGAKKRVKQAVQRAVTIFQEAFFGPENKIWVLIYGYQGRSAYGKTAGFLYQQFPAAAFAEFYNQPARLASGWLQTDAAGNEVAELVKGRIIIGKLKVRDIGFENILMAIANTEMGFRPALDERVYFIDPQTNRIFHMADDRSCLVASNSAASLRRLYLERNNWITEYNRAEIDAYFQ